MNKQKSQENEVKVSNKSITNDVQNIDINEVLESLEPEKRAIIEKTIIAIEERSSYSGPLPPPEDFKAYGDVLPNAPERILNAFEKQLSHRVETEKEIVNNGI
jgi:uncharacterized membrane protein